MKYTIPLHPDCLDWLKEQPVCDQALLGWTLRKCGIPGRPVKTNYEVTVEDLERTLIHHFGMDYHEKAKEIIFRDEYEFVPAHSRRATVFLTIFYKALPYIAVFLTGLVCGMDF